MTDLDQPGTRPRAASARQRGIDAGIALAITAVQLVAHYGSTSWGGHRHGTASWASYLLLAVPGMALVARRRFPVAVLAVSLAATLWAGALGGGFIWLGLIAAFVNAVIAGKRAAATASLAAGYLVSFWPPWLLGQPGHASVAAAVAAAAWLTVLLAVAELIRSWRQRTMAQRRSREEHFRRLASEDRMRMARDLHDVLAHNISVINVQANTTLHLMDRQPERAREALTAIYATSKQALAELRSVLGILREDEGPGGAPTAPSPGLSMLPDLVSAVRSTGLDVRLVIEGDNRPLPAGADVGAYRVIQESLTNITRHSAATAGLVRVRFDPAGVTVEVEDHGPAKAVPSSGQAGRIRTGASQASGSGIAGMAARVRELGGTLDAGPSQAGGFAVAAWLPADAGDGTAAGASAAAAGASASGASTAADGAGSPGGSPRAVLAADVAREPAQDRPPAGAGP